MTKQIVGLTEKITVIGRRNRKEVVAKFDTGADTCSIDNTIANKIGVRTFKKVTVKSSGKTRTGVPVGKIIFIIRGRELKGNVKIEDRSKLKYRILIGGNILRNNFIVDASK